MDSEQVLEEHLKNYRMLVCKVGKDDPETVKALSDLMDLTIVEVYFMKPVRYLLGDDEMGAFVLYVNGSLEKIFDKYCPGKGPFIAYLTVSMENYAMNYLKQKKREENAKFIYTYYDEGFAMGVAEPSAEEAFIRREEQIRMENFSSRTLEMLRYSCALNPNKRIKLFVFLSTLLPFLSLDIIDKFCSALNIDEDETFAIARYLSSLQDVEKSSRHSRYYIEKRLDFHWMKLMQLEGIYYYTSGRENVLDKLQYHRKKQMENVKSLNASKMNVPYPVVARLLNLSEDKVSIYVLYAKRILERSIENARIGRVLTKPQRREMLPFRPFGAFGISVIERPVARRE